MSAEATERIVNLAIYLAAAREPAAAATIQREVEGYPADQDEAAFLRMFERDKDELRAMGFAIVSDSQGGYALDASATFATEITFTPEEAALLGAVGGALAEDPSFPFAEDLRLALSKIATALDAPDAAVRVRLADEAGAAQGRTVAQLNRAVAAHKRASFGYTNSRSENRAREVEPYGLFLRDGRWYLVARDTKLDDIRVFTVARIADLTVNSASPKTADFSRPADFDVASFIGVPFQYGTDEIDVVVRFAASEAWRAPSLASGAGSLEPVADGSIDWHVTVRDDRRLLRWLVENGPGITVVTPRPLADALDARMREVARAHG